MSNPTTDPTTALAAAQKELEKKDREISALQTEKAGEEARHRDTRARLLRAENKIEMLKGAMDAAMGWLGFAGGR
ncbi:hypothetical protein PRZ48_005247 [Zasmidium cellare]|uniref:Uncharacterized protein n=1 Tax=Zasmidium cellare TaxID=395010 RepID=A0ABR0ERW9_ZASCE|nr:hypothetical protein PRZ48_005247 [Zasmidium cellare]